MHTCLLKRVLPFTLTFIIGAAIGGFYNPFGAWRASRRVVLRTELMRDYDFGEGHRCKYGRFKRRDLAAESNSLVILFKPDARLPHGLKAEGSSVLANVTFGADGKVGEVSQVGAWYGPPGRFSRLPPVWAAVERAAQQIQFEPEIINGLPVSVTKDVEIYFLID